MANTEKSEPEIEMSPEQKAQYRLMLAETLRSARTYGGDETSFDRLIETGDRLDQWMRNTFGSGKKLDDEAEEKIAEKADAPKVRTIDSVLDIASKSFRAAMEEPRTLGEKLKKLSIVHSTIDRVLLPPGTQEVIGEDGTGEWKEAKTEPRIESLLAVLQEHGIFKDDLIVTLGITKPNMMRKESYALIEIPRIGREVLVCNQVGEATFVSRGHLDLQTYLQKTKEEIGELEGVERIVSPGLGEWETRVIEALLKDISAGETRKIDIKNMDALRRAIMEKCQTGKEWMGMTQKQRHAFKIAGRGEIAIATALGLKLKNACRNPYEHALLGQAIYGSAIEIIQALNDEKEWLVIAENPEKLKELVRAAFPTAKGWKGWIGMTRKQMYEFKILGRGEIAIATALGLKLKNPCGNFYEHALLGQAIYGSTIEINQALNEEKEWLVIAENPEKLKELVRAAFPTAKGWIGMTSKQMYEFKILGRGEIAIATALGLKLKNPCGNFYEHALLGQAIYGSTIEINQALNEEKEWLVIAKKPEKLKELVRSAFPTAKGWIGMTRKQMYEFKILGRGERAITSALGLKLKNPCSNNYEHALLGQAIYGNQPEIMEALQKYQSSSKED